MCQAVDVEIVTIFDVIRWGMEHVVLASIAKEQE